jgi:hypothetical protein
LYPIVKYGLPIAQDSRMDEMARRMAEGFSDGPVRFGDGVWWVTVLIVGGLLAAVAVLALQTGRRHRRAMPSNPRRLFAGLCQAHGLARDDRRLLQRLAGSQGLDAPARLFLEPERFDPAALPARLRSWGARFQAIRGRLFAGLSEEVPAPPVPGDQAAAVPGIPGAAIELGPPAHGPVVNT